MYKCMALAVVLMAFGGRIVAQQCAPLTTVNWAGAQVEDMYFMTYTNENTVYTGGKSGQFGKATFSNGSWTFATISIAGVSDDSRAGYFYPNTTVGFFATDKGKLYKTTNDGSSFTEMTAFNTLLGETDVNHIVFAPAPMQNLGFVAASNGLYVTTNGGENWTKQTLFTNSKLNSTYTGDGFFYVTVYGNKAYASTDTDNEGQVLWADISTVSGSYSWTAMQFTSANTELPTGYYMSQEKGRSIAVTPNGTIWHSGDEVLLKANNTGSAFQVVTVPGSADGYEIRGVSFFDDMSGAFTNENFEVYITKNGGQSWVKVGEVLSEPKAIVHSPKGYSLAIAADAASNNPGVFINTFAPASATLRAGLTSEGATLGICSGTNIAVSVLGTNLANAKYDFSIGNSVVQSGNNSVYAYAPSVSGVASAMITTTGACVAYHKLSTGSISINVSSQVTFAATVTGPSQAVCAGIPASVSVNATGAVNPTVSYYINDALVSSPQIPTVAGVYAFKAALTTDLTCASPTAITTTSVNVTVTSNCVTSNEEFTFDSESVKVYPNPAENLVNISLLAGEYWNMASIDGTTVASGTASANGIETLSLSGYAKGVYLVSIYSSKTIKRVRLVIN